MCSDLQQRIDELRARLAGLQDAGSRLDQTESLLRELNDRLDGLVTWELRRELVEILTGSIVVNTARVGDSREATVTVTYRFGGGQQTHEPTAAVSHRYRYQP